MMDSWFGTVLFYSVLFNAVFGLIAFEWAWKRFHRFRHPNEQVSDLFPALRRDDSPKWSKWKFYPGAVLTLIPRFCCFVCAPVFGYSLVMWPAMLGHNRSTVVTGVRRTIKEEMIKLVCRIFLALLAVRINQVNLSQEDVDHYQEYLGTKEEQKRCQDEKTPDDPRVPKRGPGPVSTIISNHISFTEVWAQLCTHPQPAFAARAETTKAPILGDLSYLNNNLHINRGSD